LPNKSKITIAFKTDKRIATRLAIHGVARLSPTFALDSFALVPILVFLAAAAITGADRFHEHILYFAKKKCREIAR